MSGVDMDEAGKSCWTCKKRKIGCDRSLPRCSNCLRTGRVCLGYVTKLTWPDQTTGRRRKANYTRAGLPHTKPQRRGGRNAQHFINSTAEDIAWVLGPRSDVFPVKKFITKPTPNPGFHPVFSAPQETLLSYYRDVISTMCSTTKARNGFCTDILPIAFFGHGAPATALLNAMLAISSYHRYGRKAALPYKVRSLKALSLALAERADDVSCEPTDGILAAALMTCMYSVFDASEGNWHVHMRGIKKILSIGKCQSLFLICWAQYYSVLGALTQLPCRHAEEESASFFQQMSDSNRSFIIGPLGCSIEVLDAIGNINRMRTISDTQIHADDLEKERHRLEAKLCRTVQKLDPYEDAETTPLARDNAIAIANLYRLAALLYLQRVCKTTHGERSKYVKEAYCTLNKLPLVSCPWPVFVIACEAENEQQRAQMLDILQNMKLQRAVGNVSVMEEIVKVYWKHSDLHAVRNSVQQPPEWWMLSDGIPVPWFV